MADDPRELRERLRQRLISEGRWDLSEKLRKCAEMVTMQCVCCTDRFQTDRGCAKRWCPVCAPKVTAKRLDRVGRIVKRFQWPLSVTLTERNTADGEGCVARFKGAFRGFRRTDFWKQKVKGGVAGFEMTHRGRGWHTHLHALLDCRWLAVETPEPTRWMTKRQQAALFKRAQNELSEVWGAYIQGAKASVWVNRAWGDALEETIKYAVKPADLLECKCDAGEMIDEIDSGRMVTAFGHAHGSSRDFVGIDEEAVRESRCEECNEAKSIVPEQVLARMMEHPRRLKEHWHTMLERRLERMNIARGSAEWMSAMDEEDDWWNDE